MKEPGWAQKIPMPGPLRWLAPPARWEAPDRSVLTIAAGPGTDWFVDPRGEGEPIVSAPALVADPIGDYVLTARVTAELAETFDAGSLVLYADERTWAKLCLERSPQGEAMVVSVVTRGVSDDCNSFTLAAHVVWLRIARRGPAFAFHASTEGRFWRLVRHFALEAPAADRKGPAVGFEAQSPMGDGCAATFEDIRFAAEHLGDLRDGS